MAYSSHESFSRGFAVGATQQSIYQSGVKRVFDLAIVAIAAVPAALIVLVLAILISRDGSTPFYRQERVGKHGKRFHMIKLRSMVPNADQMLETHLANDAAARAEWDEKQKLTHDPRITRLGRFIRKTSLDELPQFFNVFVGDMSVVGPRPMMTDQTKLYPGTAYYLMRPGITGFWQTSERNECSFAERAYHDTKYARSITFLTDLKVVLRTVFVVAQGTGV
ncbi:sugar transferase [Shimia sp. MMG029]|uniref:sugar transferase n=1 Tax=Shimia sp. MMG029 TaxID=3021978 RepID=UPI0022FDBA49|nr:sugar transferase [Shimia sp. MMG029]MDA5558615.1 sugar transferase [Shimia sp. MMG029]